MMKSGHAKYILTALGILILVIGAAGCHGKQKVVTLHYAAWNLGSKEQDGMERKMVRVFMKLHPDIKIVIDEDYTSNYNQVMSDAVSSGHLPDVFMYAGNAKAYNLGICRDLSPEIDQDQEWKNLPKVLRDSVYVKGCLVALPSAVYLYGYFCNTDLIKKSGQELHQTYSGVESFVQAVKKSTSISEGRIGLADAGSICEWYPAAVNGKYGWYSWDGGKFNLNSSEFLDGMNLEKEMKLGKYDFAVLNEEEKSRLKGKNDWEAWNAGTVVFKFDGTWSTETYSKLPFTVTFTGIPGNRPCLVPDYLFISSHTGHPYEAYLFAKFMSAYSTEGVRNRVETAEKNHLLITTMAFVSDKELKKKLAQNMKMDGIRQAYQSMGEDAFLEVSKILPGYDMARWNYQTNITVGTTAQATMGEVLNAASLGEVDFKSVSSDLNYLANTCIEIYPQQLDNDQNSP